ncbi:conserved membrane hypothetical protein [Sphingomonas sp. EC-HK361]|uniref:hypothetical protein n=1 Tax=Sphingomonas sp. EC-HK361 TaxID=2038397 RepID=UPI001251332D|nr:hypothetical protein [Sphingomonas sp. EC-HK361]VVT19007.1 conserved membrane hypothetical protein [Sphingomonas sp. EC-HK361]
MSPFTGRAIGLAFATLWLLLGAGALPLPWRYVVGGLGVAAIIALVIRAWRMNERRTGLFRMGRYRLSVALEFGAIAFTSYLLMKTGSGGYLIPAVGVIVGLHFIGLWWAGGGIQYLQLAGLMTVIDSFALLLPPGSASMQAVAGLGSAAALAGIAGTGARR